MEWKEEEYWKRVHDRQWKDSGPFLGDVFDEVQEAPDEIMLGPAFISYGGVPKMDADGFSQWCKMLPQAVIEVERLTVW